MSYDTAYQSRIHPCIRIFPVLCFGVARCAFVYKVAFQILKLHLGKGGLKPPVASPLPSRPSVPSRERCL